MKQRREYMLNQQAVTVNVSKMNVDNFTRAEVSFAVFLSHYDGEKRMEEYKFKQLILTFGSCS